MFIERLRVTNFRSFRELELELSPLSVLVGANASGKTNFVQLFRFLRDVANEGFESAIALQGGVELVRNLRLGASEPLTIEIEGGFPNRMTFSPANISLRRYHYSLTIAFTRGRGGYRVAEERFRVWLEDSEARQHEATLTRHGNSMETEIPSALFRDTTRRGRKLPSSRLERGQSLLQALWILPIPNPESVFAALAELGLSLRTIVAYDFDVRAMKRPTRLETRLQLEENGENLATTLRELFRRDDNRRVFHQMLQQFLPQIQGG